jgi:AraC-like DNA-binding protein
VYRWSTDQVDEQRRFDYWREVRAKGLFGVTAELEPDRREHFFGEFSLQIIDKVGLIELRASPYRVERSACDIARAPSDSLCIYQQLGGGGWFGTGNDEDFTIQRGTFATSYSDLPYQTVPSSAHGFHLRILKIPVAEIWPSRLGILDLDPKPVGDHQSIVPLLESCFADLAAADDNIDAAKAFLLVQALAHLTLIERGVIGLGNRMAMQALRVGRLSTARHLIARHVSEPNLSPGFVAGRLGVSVRHLHALFETTDMSFSQTAKAIRLEASCRLLQRSPEQSITEVALACGFDSLATFYRAFRAAYGMAPGEFRTQGGPEI